ncbi:hypothetical protein NDU88_005853 [Pleurodeles waltl]|uniref:Uncharacterized protein n=1 Tax=Pleurodeles waltl TaxID=8319 RepID=A0AAV7WEJ7_PLEWA|nr:hypothetical protein NDU88_005853 [Pleurodeles waltl]
MGSGWCFGCSSLGSRHRSCCWGEAGTLSRCYPGTQRLLPEASPYRDSGSLGGSGLLPAPIPGPSDPGRAMDWWGEWPKNLWWPRNLRRDGVSGKCTMVWINTLKCRHAAWLWGTGATLPLDAHRSAPALPLSRTGLLAARGSVPLARRKGRVPGAGGLCA